MGKGDRRTRRGKLYRGSFGKTRLKDPAKKKTAAGPAGSGGASGSARTGAGATSASPRKG